MKIILQISTVTAVLLLMIIADIPLLPVELVPEAQAIYGVRRRAVRRTAVVVSSADAAAASSAAAASQQQVSAAQQEAATANQEAAAAKQEAADAKQEAAAAQKQLAAAQAFSGVAIGTVVQTLPASCTAVTVGGIQYQDCAGSFYRASFQGNNLVYVVVDKPI